MENNVFLTLNYVNALHYIEYTRNMTELYHGFIMYFC